jgi:glycosyltransferase involved in cell wall biosynthesis
MRIAWFSPLPPDRSGIADYSDELLAQLAGRFDIDCYPERTAHDFVWRSRRAPYDLVVYHLGNARCHDYMWAYLVRYPGLVVLHDARLHHARARCLLDGWRIDAYRDEFHYDHPAVDPAVTQFAIEGLGGPLYYLWPMVRVVMDSARSVAVHSPWVAADLREAYPRARVDTIRMGVPPRPVAVRGRSEIRRRLSLPDEAVVFAVFGKITAEKRVSAVLTTTEALAREGLSVFAMIVGDPDGYAPLAREIAARGLAGRVRVTGHVTHDAIGDHLAAADVCLCLRWPTALETSAAWLRCIAAARATVVSDLAHLVDIPADVAARVDPVDEPSSLLHVMRRLTVDTAWRETLAANGHAYWQASHAIEMMAADYERLLPMAASRPAPSPDGLPDHFLADYSGVARETIRHVGVTVDMLG